MNSGGQAHRTARNLSKSPLSSLSSSVFPPTHSLRDLFLCQQPSVSHLLSASSNSGLDKLAGSKPIVSLIHMMNLCTSYYQISNFREFVVTLHFFSFCILDSFSYALFILKIITQQKVMAGKRWHAMTEGRTHNLKSITGCGLKHRLNFQNVAL